MNPTTNQPNHNPTNSRRAKLRAILAQVIEMYHPHERYGLWHSEPRLLGRVTLMKLFENRDYQTAKSP